MDLHEDAYRLQQVLTNIPYKEIVLFLRNKAQFYDADVRCRIALEHFLKVEHDEATSEDLYMEEFNADFRCLTHLLTTIPEDDIRTTLNILGSIPNRKLVAAKLLIHQSNVNYRKRKATLTDQEENNNANGSSKLVKVADSTNSIEPIPETNINQNGNSKIPKLIIKREANKFKVSKQKQIQVEPNLVKQEPQTDEASSLDGPPVVEIDVKQEPLPSSSSIPDPLDYNEPGPSWKGWTPPPQGDQVSDSSQDSDSTVIDLNSVNFPMQEDDVAGTEPPAPVEIQLPVDEKLVLKMIEMFPDASPDYIRTICAGKVYSEGTSAEIVEVILNQESYPMRPERQPSPEKEVDPEEQLSTLKALLPDADPSFLQKKVEQLAGDQAALRQFVEDAVDNKTYPTMKDYLRQQKLSAQQRQYTSEFNMERFVELFPDPVAVFEDKNRKTTVIDMSDKYYVKWFMRNKYSQLYAKDINNAVEARGCINVLSIVEELEKRLLKGCLKKTKCISSLSPDCQNIPLLQELAYFEHKQEILKHLETKRKQDAEDKENAKQLGLLQSCSCCFDDAVMPCDILTCTGGCRFCKDCIKRSTEVAFGDGKINFPCFSNECDAEFSLQVLQTVLTPNMFSKLAQKKAVAEVKAAGIEDLEACPFCDFANIPAPEDKLFRCLNTDCMKESCRLCKEPSHVPLRCEEVEKDGDVKARTYIENKMTEALIRECWKCGAKFIKEEGCNKMTCSCGAMMCYICRQPVKDYKHFNGQGGDRLDLCPLYTDNFAVNEKNVLKAAEEAKKEVDPTQLKNDPTADLERHFGHKIKEAEKRKEQQQMRNILHGMNPGDAAHFLNDPHRLRGLQNLNYEQMARVAVHVRNLQHQRHVPPPAQPPAVPVYHNVVAEPAQPEGGLRPNYFPIQPYPMER